MEIQSISYEAVTSKAVQKTRINKIPQGGERRGAERRHEATRTTSSNWPIYEADFEGGRTQAVFEQWPTYEPTPVVLNKARERSRVLDKAPCVWSADGGRFGWIQLIH